MRRIESGWTSLRHPIGFTDWNSQQSLKAFLCGHGNPIPTCDKSAKRADIPRLPRLLFEQELDHGGQSKRAAALEPVDRVEDQRRVEGRHQYTGPTGDDGWEKADTNRGDVRHLRHHQNVLQTIGRSAAHQLHAIQQGSMSVCYALWTGGRA